MLTHTLLSVGSTTNSPLAISICWCVYNALPHFLVLWYVLVSKGMSLQYMCRLCILLSFFCGALAVGLIWGLYPRSYSYKVSPSTRLCQPLVSSMWTTCFLLLSVLTTLPPLLSCGT